MTNKPSVSIIVPVYNAEKQLERCVYSILNQSLDAFELILVDDGSTDSSPSICDKITDRRVKVIHKANGGPASARNAGLDAATGEYIGFVDSDDWIEKDMFSAMYSKAVEKSADIVACGVHRVGEYGKAEGYKAADERTYDSDGAMAQLTRNTRLTFSVYDKLYKSSLFENLRFKEGIIFEDMDISYKLIDIAQGICCIPAAYYFHSSNSESILGKSFTLMRLNEFTAKKEMYAFYKEHYPLYANEVYGSLFYTGIILYSNIRRHYYSERKTYKYLIQAKRSRLLKLLLKKNYPAKMKLAFAVSLLSPYAAAAGYSAYRGLKKMLKG